MNSLLRLFESIGTVTCERTGRLSLKTVWILLCGTGLPKTVFMVGRFTGCTYRYWRARPDSPEAVRTFWITCFLELRSSTSFGAIGGLKRFHGTAQKSQTSGGFGITSPTGRTSTS